MEGKQRRATRRCVQCLELWGVQWELGRCDDVALIVAQRLVVARCVPVRPLSSSIQSRLMRMWLSLCTFDFSKAIAPKEMRRQFDAEPRDIQCGR